MRRLCFSEMFEYSVKGITLITKQPQNINKLPLVLLKVSILVNIWVSDNFTYLRNLLCHLFGLTQEILLNFSPDISDK